jgi:hypothetical protein
VRRSSSRSSRRTSMRSPWIHGHCRAKRVMTHILVELLLCHRLNHERNVWSKGIGSERVGGYVVYLIHNILEDIKVHRLHPASSSHKQEWPLNSQFSVPGFTSSFDAAQESEEAAPQPWEAGNHRPGCTWESSP